MLLLQLCLNSLDQVADKQAEQYSCEITICADVTLSLSAMGSSEWRDGVGRMVKAHKLGKTTSKDALAM